MAVNGIEIEVGQKWRIERGGVVRIGDRDPDNGMIRTHYMSGTGVVAYVNEQGVSKTGRYNLIELVEHADGFKPWAGGEQPEETCGKRVEVRLNDGFKNTGRADDFFWKHDGNADIVAYKVVGEVTQSAPEPEPLHVELIEPEVSAPALLNAAAGHMAARASTYDKPEGERSMAQTVAVFKAHHGIELTEAQGWHFMQILKDVRLFTRESYHADSAEDCIAYAALKAEALAREGGAK